MFSRYRTAAALALAGLSAPVTSARAAQETAAPGAEGNAAQAVEDGARIAVAREIVAIAWPAETRNATMKRLLSAFTDQFKGSMDLDSIEDEGLRTIVVDFLDSIPDILKPAVEDFLPDQMEAIAGAYARLYSRPELEDILAFARTPSGQAFLSRSTEVMSDPAVAAANTAYFKQVHALSQKAAADLQARIEAYANLQPAALPGT